MQFAKDCFLIFLITLTFLGFYGNFRNGELEIITTFSLVFWVYFVNKDKNFLDKPEWF